MPPRGVAKGTKRARRSGTNRPKGRTAAQLYQEARKLNVPGRSKMNKAQLEWAVNRKKS
jgi:hypothetical protein